jgi:hypothetical protein
LLAAAGAVLTVAILLLIWSPADPLHGRPAGGRAPIAERPRAAATSASSSAPISDARLENSTIAAEAPKQSGDPEEATNRLKQFGLGLAAFQEAPANRPLPAPSRLPVSRQVSWVVELLPFLGRSDLFEQIHSSRTTGEDRPWNDDENRAAIADVIGGLLAPDMDSEATWFDSSGAALTGYAGVAGSGPAAPELPPGTTDPLRGFFGCHRIATRAEITDGLSATAMLMEVRKERGPWAQNGPATVRPIEAFQGGLMLMADGSVRALTLQTDRKVLRAMATIAAGD